MRCKELEGLISPYIDNELSEEDRELFEAHLKECRECNSINGIFFFLIVSIN